MKSQLSVLDKRNRDNPFENITDSDVEDAVDDLNIQSVSSSLAEFPHNKIVQSPHENYFNVCRQHKEK